MAKNLKELLERKIVQLAKLPLKNEFNIEKLDDLDGYVVPIIAHDYGAKTPLMWNTVYEHLGLKIRNIMLVVDPKNLSEVIETFRRDPRYLGGGAGVGFKEIVIPHLDSKHPEDLTSVNIIVKDGKRLIGYNTDSKGLYISVADALKKEKKEIKGSNFLIFGAGGVAKEFARQLAENEAERIIIVNRTYSKAVVLAYELNTQFGRNLAFGIPEDLIRGSVLNTIKKSDAIINCTDKGSDGALVDTSAFASASEHNNTLSIDNLRLLKNWNPLVVIVDIVLPKNGRSITLRHAASVNLENLVDGIPMVVNQAAPAYKLIEAAYPSLHKTSLDEGKVLDIMRKAVYSLK